MIPYCRHRIGDGDRAAVAAVLDSPRLTQGPGVTEFEAALCGRIGADHAVAVSSGTSALQIAVQALGVEPGDEILVPSLTFLATANAVLLSGARPIFVDIDPATLALDPEDLARRVGPRTRGAIGVHYAGHAADVGAWRAALGSDRFLIEDACHALGATRAGSVVGSASEAACYSFHPAKHITTGEGGAILSCSAELTSRLKQQREHGMVRDARGWTGLGLPAELAAEQSGGWVYEMQSLSGNHRLSDLGASLGTSQLAGLEENLAARRRLAGRYAEAFAGSESITLLEEPENSVSAWHLYPIRLAVEQLRGGRAAVYAALHQAGVGVQVHYIPIHLQPFYRARFGTRYGDLPRTEDAYLRLLSLPLFPDLSDADQDFVIGALFEALLKCKR